MSEIHSGDTVKCRLCGNVSKVFRNKDTDYSLCPVCQFPIRSDSAIPLTDANLNKFIEQSRIPMVVVFWAPYDPVCRDFMPLVDGAVTYSKGNGAIVASVDVSRNPEMKRLFGIMELPCILLFDRGIEMNRIVGAISQYELDRLISFGKM